MKIVRFKHETYIAYGIVAGELIKKIDGMPWDKIIYTGETFNLKSVKLLAPVEPKDVFAIGLNYKAHAEEGWDNLPDAPIVFIKASSSVTNPLANIILPQMAPNEVDYEAELVIVIGKTCHNVSEADALDYVLGYTCGNDVSARDCQIKLDKQWARAKSFDTFCPLGPWIETDIDPDNVNISSKLNGTVMQSSNTSKLIFSCSKLVSYISQIATMQPGTIIMTGTPEGVGFARKPQVFLKDGDIIEVIVDGIGTLVNTVKAGII